MGQRGDGEEHEQAHDPASPLEGVGQTQNTSTHYSYEDVRQRLGLRRQRPLFSDERSVLPRQRRIEPVGGGASHGLVVKNHQGACFEAQLPNSLIFRWEAREVDDLMSYVCNLNIEKGASGFSVLILEGLVYGGGLDDKEERLLMESDKTEK